MAKFPGVDPLAGDCYVVPGLMIAANRERPPARQLNGHRRECPFARYNENATSDASAPWPTAITTNCWPERVRYVIGVPYDRPPRGPCHRSFPLVLSIACRDMSSPPTKN